MIDAASLQARGVVSRYFDRVRTPAQTLAALRPTAREFGITRLARLTGLDEVGIPVWAAIRPNAATLAVSQGKGVDDDAAAASAMMEAIEVAAAERGDLPRLTLSSRAMAASGRRVALLTEMLRLGAAPPDADEPIDWIEGFDLMDDARSGSPSTPSGSARRRLKRAIGSRPTVWPRATCCGKRRFTACASASSATR